MCHIQFDIHRNVISCCSSSVIYNDACHKHVDRHILSLHVVSPRALIAAYSTAHFRYHWSANALTKSGLDTPVSVLRTYSNRPEGLILFRHFGRFHDRLIESGRASSNYVSNSWIQLKNKKKNEFADHVCEFGKARLFGSARRYSDAINNCFRRSVSVVAWSACWAAKLRINQLHRAELKKHILSCSWYTLVFEWTLPSRGLFF